MSEKEKVKLENSRKRQERHVVKQCASDKRVIT